MSYMAPVFRVAALARSIRFYRAFERAEHLDACAMISAAAKLSAEFAGAGAPFPVPLRNMT